MTARQGGARIKRRLMFALEIAIAVSAIVSGSVQAQVKSFEGLTLKLASQNDQFAAVLADLTPEFKQATGVTVKVDILGKPPGYSSNGRPAHLFTRNSTKRVVAVIFASAKRTILTS